MTYAADERKFWADAFCAMMHGDAELLPTNAAEHADTALAAYRQRFGNCSETPNSSPNETGEAVVAFYKALTNSQIPRAAAAASYFTRRGSTFCVRVSRVDADEAASPAPPPPAFSGEPEPITDGVLRSLGFYRHDYGPWQIEGDELGTIVYRDAESESPRLATDLTDARKLRAIMEIVRS